MEWLANKLDLEVFFSASAVESVCKDGDLNVAAICTVQFSSDRQSVVIITFHKKPKMDAKNWSSDGDYAQSQKYI